MHPSLRLCSAGARKPLIQFVGKRKWPSTRELPHPHPAAPAELKQSFSDFLAKFESSKNARTQAKAQTSQGVQVYEEFWQAPKRLWERRLNDAEIEAIQTGGASLY